MAASLLRSARRGTHLSLSNVAASQYAWEVPDAPGKPAHPLLSIEGSLLRSATIVPPAQQRIIVANDVLIGYGYPRVTCFANGGGGVARPRGLGPPHPSLRSKPQDEPVPAAAAPGSSAGASERQASTLASGHAEESGGALVGWRRSLGRLLGDRMSSWLPTALTGTLMGTAAGSLLVGDAVAAQIIWDTMWSVSANAQSLVSGLGDIAASACEPAWVAARSSLGSAWHFYQDSLVTHPHTTPMVLTGITYLAADVIAQRYEGNSLLEFKAERIARSTLTGLLVLGPLAHGYYTTQDEIILRIWPELPLHSYVLKMAIDNTVYCFTYNLVYYLSLGTMKGNPVSATLEDFRGAWWRLQTAGWKFWPYVGMVTHTVIPTEHKVLFVDAAEIGWVTYLSISANSKRAQNQEKLHGMMAGSAEVAEEPPTASMAAQAELQHMDGSGRIELQQPEAPEQPVVRDLQAESVASAAVVSHVNDRPQAPQNVQEEDLEPGEAQPQQRVDAEVWEPLPTDSFPRDHLLLANDVERAIAERLSTIESLQIELEGAFHERLADADADALQEPQVKLEPEMLTQGAPDVAAPDLSAIEALALTPAEPSSTEIIEEPPVQDEAGVVQPLDLDELVSEEIVAMVQDVAQSLDDADAIIDNAALSEPPKEPSLLETADMQKKRPTATDGNAEP